MKEFREKADKSILVRCIFLMVFFLAAEGIAKDAVSLYVENDSRLMKPISKTDRHYTHGMKFVYLTQPDWQWLEDFSKWNTARSDEPADAVVGFFVGQHIYTPDNVAKPAQRKPKDMVCRLAVYGYVCPAGDCSPIGPCRTEHRSHRPVVTSGQCTGQHS